MNLNKYWIQVYLIDSLTKDLLETQGDDAVNKKLRFDYFVDGLARVKDFMAERE